MGGADGPGLMRRRSAGRRSLAATLACACALLACALPQHAWSEQAVRVHALRMANEFDRLRIVLDLSAPLRCVHRWRERPLRLELLCENAMLESPAALPEAAAPVERIDHQHTAQGDLHLRFEMPRRYPVTPLHLPPSPPYPHHRLVLDLPFASDAINYALSGPAPVTAPAGVPLALAPDPVQRREVPAAMPAPKGPVTVAIDAGHGGKDPGSMAGALREADIVLDIARRIAKRFADESGYRPYLVRGGDVFVALKQRPAKARAQGADIFLSVHADSIKHKKPKGSAVYILSLKDASSAEAQFLSDRANRSALIPGVSLDAVSENDPGLASLLVNLAGQDTRAQNAELGKTLLRSLSTVNRLHKKHVESAGFLVLHAPDMPSALVEVGFLSNPEEARLLSTAKHREHIASALFEGIDDYVRAHPRYGLASKAPRATRRYIVRVGDTLFGLARRFGASPGEIRRMNGMHGDGLQAGQRLRVPVR